MLYIKINKKQASIFIMHQIWTLDKQLMNLETTQEALWSYFFLAGRFF